MDKPLSIKNKNQPWFYIFKKRMNINKTNKLFIFVN